MNSKNTTKKLIFGAIFLALSYVMPFLTGQIPQFGSMLCPMHIPVLLCGFLCGWQMGLAVGITAPLLRSFTLGMPPMFPVAVCMAFELATYGAASGIIYRILPRKKTSVYITLITSMIIGRIIWGVAMLICMGINNASFGISAFLAGAVTNAIPGIIIQIVLIPLIVMALEHTSFSEKRNSPTHQYH